MEFGNAKEKELLPEQSSWVPLTPAKLVHVRRQPVCVEKQWKNHLGQSFLPGNSREEAFNKASSMSSHAMAMGKNQKEGTAQIGGSKGLIDLNMSVSNWEEEDSCFGSKKEAALGEKQETENPSGRLACFDLNNSRDSGKVNFSTERTKDTETCPESMGFGNLKKGLGDWDAPLVNIPFTELLGMANEAPLSANMTAAQAAVEKSPSSFFPFSHSQINSSLQVSGAPSSLLTDHDPTSSANLWNNNKNQEIQMQQYDIPNPEKDEQDIVPRTGTEDSNLHHDEHAEPIDGSASSTPLQKRNAKKRSNSGIKLNKKPQHRTKTKKHRPKVVVEGKPKRTPKPKTPKPVTPKRASSQKDQSVKRKYVRKNKLEDTSTPPEDATGEAIDPISERPKKSCKRALNFDMENHSRDESAVVTASHQYQLRYRRGEKSWCRWDFELNLGSHNSCSRTINKSGTDSTLKPNKGKEPMVENTASTACDFSHSKNWIRTDHMSLAETQAAATLPHTKNPLWENLEVLSGNRNDTQTVDLCQNMRANRCIEDHQGHEDTIGRVLPADTGCRQSKSSVALMLQSDPSLVKHPNDSKCSNHEMTANAKHAERSTREYCQAIDLNNPRATNQTGCLYYNSLQVVERILRVDQCLSNSRKLGPNFPKICKKKRIRRERKLTMSSPLWSVAAAAHGKRQAKSCKGYNANGHSTLRTTNRLSAPQLTLKKLHNSPRNSDIYCRSVIANCNLQKPKSSSEMLSDREAQTRAAIDKQQSFKSIQTLCYLGVKVNKKKSNRFTRRRNLASLTAIPCCNQSPPTPLKQVSIGERKRIDIFHGPEASMDSLVVDNTRRTVTKEQTELGPYLVNAESNISKSEGCPPRQEDFLLAAELRGGCNMASQTVISNYNQSPSIPAHTGESQRPKACMDTVVANKQKKKVAKRQTEMGPSLVNAEFNNSKSEGYQREHNDFSLTAKDPLEVLQRKSIDFIIQRLKRLHISDGPYNSNDALVPYLGPFDPTKKRKQLPKINLDPETMRVWKLLMETDGCGVEDMDEGKKKWWEEEINVFRGRVDSFIARMHLIQGDRRFSPWKGSVVDSVVGVFLTQNVADYLSSSAFMSLAAKFPLQSTTSQDTCYEDWESPNSQESIGSNIVIVEPADDSNEKQSLGSETEQDMNSAVENKAETLIERTGRASLVESSTVQTADGDDLCFASNTEADLIMNCRHYNMESSTSFKELLQLENTTLLQEFYSLESENLSCDESPRARHRESSGIEYGTQRSSSDKLDGLNGTHMPIYSSDPHNFKVSPVPSNPEVDCLELLGDKGNTQTKNVGLTSKKLGLMEDSESEITFQQKMQAQEAITVDPYASPDTCHAPPECSSHANFRVEKNSPACNDHQRGNVVNLPSKNRPVDEPKSLLDGMLQSRNSKAQPSYDADSMDKTKGIENAPPGMEFKEREKASLKRKKKNINEEKATTFDWDSLRKSYSSYQRQSNSDTMDSVDWEAIRRANLAEVAKTILERGMNTVIAGRIKDFLDRLVGDHGSIDLEWLRDVPPDKAKEFLLSICGLGLKSVECVRLLTLQHIAFPVDTNVGRIAVRLGWVPLQPLPENLHIHLLEQYPLMDSIQKYLWPRLRKFDQRTLYELHYQMITFGKVFCTKRNPKCNACPMRGECRHFASAFASAKLALPGPQEKSVVSSMIPVEAVKNTAVVVNPILPSLLEANPYPESGYQTRSCEPIIEVPASPEPECTEMPERDIEDLFKEDSDEIPTIKLNIEEFTANIQDYMQKNNMMLQEGDMSKALVAITSETASSPMPKLKRMSRLRTEHQVYELPDSHPLLIGLDRREPDDPCPYLLAIWRPGETANSSEPLKKRCASQESGHLCNEETCFPCNSIQEQNPQIIRGTILIPCRTAMRGRFPLNGTYFQVNEVFADDESSQHPINVPTAWIWNLRRRIVYFGTSTSAIFKGLSTEEIQHCFWQGYVCVRGFNRNKRVPSRPILRFHAPPGKVGSTNTETDD